MRVSRAFPVNLPADQIDMYRWVTCTIGAEFQSALLGALARANGSRFFIRRHLVAEGAAFARNIERKFASRSAQEEEMTR